MIFNKSEDFRENNHDAQVKGDMEHQSHAAAAERSSLNNIHALADFQKAGLTRKRQFQKRLEDSLN